MAQPAMPVCSHRKLGLPTITHMALMPSCTILVHQGAYWTVAHFDETARSCQQR